MKLTKNRTKVLEFIQTLDKPASVKYITRALDLDLTTVYRAVDYLVQSNSIYIYNIENQNYYYKEKSNNIFICEECLDIEVFEETKEQEDILNAEESKILKNGMELKEHTVIFKGTCEDCSIN